MAPFLGVYVSEKELLLKWGTVKGWDGLEPKDIAFLEQYFKDGQPLSCTQDKPTKERREILCNMIRQFDGVIWNDWEDKKMTKEEAISYLENYQ